MKLFVDASAIVAIIAGEQDADTLAKRMDEFAERITSAIARWESVVALHRSHDYDWRYAQSSVDALLVEKQISLVSIGDLEGQMALNAFGNYGRGNHPAALNMGDCFAYACANANEAQLLYKGDDFARTDLA